MAALRLKAPNIFLYSRDPGPTNQLVAAREAVLHWPPSWSPALSALQTPFPGLKNGPGHTHIVARTFAHTVWDRAAVTDRLDWDTIRSPDMDFDAIQSTFSHILRTMEISGVITGVEDIDELDVRALWQAARSHDIPIVVLFDATHTADLRLKGPENTIFIPDLVVVPNRDVENILRAQDIPASHICVARPSYLDYLDHHQANDVSAIAQLRQKWRDSAQNKDADLILFASENTSEMASLGREGRYSEHRVLTELLDHLQSGHGLGQAAPDATRIKIIIRPHPRDPDGKYTRYLKRQNLDVVVDQDGSPTQAAQAADVVLGMDSALLQEAALLGKPSYSLVGHAEFAKHPRAYLDLKSERKP